MVEIVRRRGAAFREGLAQGGRSTLRPRTRTGARHSQRGSHKPQARWGGATGCPTAKRPPPLAWPKVCRPREVADHEGRGAQARRWSVGPSPLAQPPGHPRPRPRRRPRGWSRPLGGRGPPRGAPPRCRSRHRRGGGQGRSRRGRRPRPWRHAVRSGIVAATRHTRRARRGRPAQTAPRPRRALALVVRLRSGGNPEEDHGGQDAPRQAPCEGDGSQTCSRPLKLPKTTVEPGWRWSKTCGQHPGGLEQPDRSRTSRARSSVRGRASSSARAVSPSSPMRRRCQGTTARQRHPTAAVVVLVCPWCPGGTAGREQEARRSMVSNPIPCC